MLLLLLLHFLLLLLPATAAAPCLALNAYLTDTALQYQLIELQAQSFHHLAISSQGDVPSQPVQEQQQVMRSLVLSKQA